MESNKKTFVGTVGYHILGNHSIAPMLLPELQKMNISDHIKIDELNWGPVAVIQNFQAEEIPYQKVILLCAIERPERQIGEITIYKWGGKLPDEEQIQACMGDAATGVISVENLLVLGEYFEIWKDEVYLIDVEPGEEIAGEQLTPEVEKQIPEILKIAHRLATEQFLENEKVSYLFGDKIFANG